MDDTLSDDIMENNSIIQIQSSGNAEMSSSMNSGVQVSAFSRLKAKVVGLCLYAVQRWPSVCSLPHI